MNQIQTLKNKIDVYDIKQNTMKLLQNSLYGILSNKGFWFSDLRLSASVTAFARRLITHLDDNIDAWFYERYGFKVMVAGDTDSSIMSWGKLVDLHFTKKEQKQNPYQICEFITNFYKENIIPIIDRSIDDIAKEINFQDYQQEHRYVRINLETIGDISLFKAKKKYCIRILVKDGIQLAKPKLKIKGIELVTRNVPKLLKPELENVLELILDRDIAILRDRIDEVERMVYSSKPCDVFEVKPLRKMIQYAPIGEFKYPKGTGAAYRGAWNYNQLVEKFNLFEKYTPFQGSESVHVIPLTKPNMYNIDTICIPLGGVLPPEFDLDEFVKYGETFEKQYWNKVKQLLEAAKIQLYEKEVFF